MDVYQDSKSPIQRRVTAYLMLMKSPELALVTEVVNTLNEQDPQLRAFVASHLNNIQSSEDSQMQQ